MCFSFLKFPETSIALHARWVELKSKFEKKKIVKIGAFKIFKKWKMKFLPWWKFHDLKILAEEMDLQLTFKNESSWLGKYWETP